MRKRKILSDTITVSRHRVFKTLVLSWGFLTFIFLWVKHLLPHQTFIFVADCLALFFLMLLAFLIARLVSLHVQSKRKT